MFERTLESVRTLKVNGVREDVRVLIVFDNFPTAFMIVLDCKDRLGFVKQHKCYFVTFDDDEKKEAQERFVKQHKCYFKQRATARRLVKPFLGLDLFCYRSVAEKKKEIHG